VTYLDFLWISAPGFHPPSGRIHVPFPSRFLLYFFLFARCFFFFCCTRRQVPHFFCGFFFKNAAEKITPASPLLLFNRNSIQRLAEEDSILCLCSPSPPPLSPPPSFIRGVFSSIFFLYFFLFFLFPFRRFFVHMPF